MHEFDSDEGKQPTWRQWLERLNQIDVNEYAQWSRGVKFAICLVAMLVIGAVGYVAVIQPKLDDLEQQQQQQITLLETFQQQQQQWQQVQSLQAQRDMLEQQKQQQLSWFNQPHEMALLLEKIHEVGRNAGISLNYIRLQDEIEHDFFTEQPLLIEAEGDYHRFGRFISDLAQLEINLTVHNFVIHSQQGDSNHMPTIRYKVLVKSYIAHEFKPSTATVSTSSEQGSGETQ